jgi:hypothetical protein
MTKHVCEECIDDRALQKVIQREAVALKCNYCERNSDGGPIAAPISELMPLIREGIAMEWAHPGDEAVPWDSEEGRYIVPVYDSQDLLESVIDTASEELLLDLAHLLGDDEWCQKHAARLTRDEEWYLDWENFSDQVKHHTRYVFYRVEPEESDVYEPTRSPHEVLDTIGELVLEQDLVRTVAVGTTISRARPHGADEAFSTVNELGPPPTDVAIYSNRMSPSGIPMFYGSTSEDTALAEVGGADFATVAEFLTLQPLLVLDLTCIPPVPSLFDEHINHLRPALKFLWNFTEDLSKRIEKDGREHIEYVPTQVATEYFRRVFRDLEDQELRGIVYPSSRHEGGVSWVLFFENDDCTQDDSDEAEGKWLSMVVASVRRRDLRNRVAPPPIGRLF